MDLSVLREAILLLREEIRMLKAGELDASLVEVSNYAIAKTDRFEEIESKCTFASPPSITQKQVTEAMNEAGEGGIETVCRMH